MVHDAITCLQLLVQEHRRCNTQPKGLEIQPDMVGLVKHSTRQKVPASRPKNTTAQPDLFGNEADALESLNFFDDDERESQPDDEMQNFESIIRLSETLQELPVGGVPTKNILNTLEANLIRTALAQTGGNVSHAAGLLQLGRTTVIQKMAKYDIKVEERV